MKPSERSYGVWLHDAEVGYLHQRGDYSWLALHEEYVTDPQRYVLGLTFEDDLRRQHASSLRCPPWFSNLLPEGRLRDWIADDRGVSVDREMELLAQVGRDLPGAVRILPLDEDLVVVDRPLQAYNEAAIGQTGHDIGWRFSLAGVGLKFSMLRSGERLTLPAFGEGGDWIVKLPDQEHSMVPLNEYSMMRLAQLAGVVIPECRLIRRSEVDGLPDAVWGGEDTAYAVKRFDRGEGRTLVHIEDFAQVQNKYPYGGAKYEGNFETVAAICYRGHDDYALEQFVRRLTVNVVIANGDAHIKNWSLIYPDGRRPTVSPAYDIVSTSVYKPNWSPEDLGLKFGGSRRFSQVSLRTFSRLQERLGATIDLADIAQDTVDRLLKAWPSVADGLAEAVWLRESVTQNIAERTRTLI